MTEKAVPQGGGFPLLLPDLLCQVAAAVPAQHWEVRLGRRSFQLGQVSEQQVRKAVHRSCSMGEMQKLSLTSAASLPFIFNYLPFAVIRWGGAKFADRS